MKLTEHHLQLDGKRYYYWTAGNPQKPPVVFLHGFLGNHKGLLWLAEFFERDYFVIMPDFPACGKSDSLADEEAGIKAYAAWFGKFLTGIGTNQPVIIGHSFGARVATYFAAHYPQQVSKMVLLAPVVRVEKFWAHVATWAHQFINAVPVIRASYVTNPLYQHFVFWLMFKGDDKAKRVAIVHDSLDEAKKVDAKLRIEILDDLYHHDFEKLAANITAPCMVIAGSKDDIVKISSMQSLVANMKNAKLIVMENTGHMLPIEHPEFTAETIKSWLRNVQNT